MKARLLDQFDWLEHEFGTRQDAIDQSGMASLKQIHSNLVLVAVHRGLIGEADALITATAGTAVSIRTADCYPILLADSKTHAVAAIHAGWRGTAAGIVGKALERMGAEFGTNPADVSAAIGPGIGICCYEVGAEVASQFGLSEKGKIDLAAANCRQLLDKGVPAANIETIRACTFCNAEQFFSYRRDGEKAGRMISFIRIQPPQLFFSNRSGDRA